MGKRADALAEQICDEIDDAVMPPVELEDAIEIVEDVAQQIAEHCRVSVQAMRDDLKARGTGDPGTMG